jgi:cytochrome b6-f complex iron-sulfur subunit
MPRFSRRDFLKLATDGLLIGAGLLGVAGLIRFLGFETESAPTEFDLGPASKYPDQSRTVLLYIPAILVHANSQFVAYSLVCTHLGCTVEPKGQEFACPCHGSRFDANGRVLKGPADRPLQQLRVARLQDGNLRLYMD